MKQKKWIRDVLLILAANTIYALGVVMFLLPNGFIMGGTTGLALAAQNYFGIPITGFVSVFNIGMFLLGAGILGKKFAMTTILSTFYYPFILGVLQNIPELAQTGGDMMLFAVFGGGMIGIGIGIVIRCGASTGGMDIPPLLARRFFVVSVSITMYVLDVVILLLQASFSDRTQILYGILLVLLYTVVLEEVLVMGEAKTQVKIISTKYEAINEMIIRDLDRGSTLLHGETGFLREERPVLLTVISNRELSRLSRAVQEMDPEAFLVISQVKEVRGRGFSLQKMWGERKWDGDN